MIGQECSYHGKISRGRSPLTQRKDLHALQRTQRDSCDNVPQMRVQETAPQEQGKKGVIPDQVFSFLKIFSPDPCEQALSFLFREDPVF
jgi:hypothetical protein